MRKQIPKPEHKMKTVAKQIEQCLYHNNCKGCWYKLEPRCQVLLMSDGLWYLRQTLEKSEKKTPRETVCSPGKSAEKADLLSPQ